MKSIFKNHDYQRTGRAILCVAIGTGFGLVVYIIFLILHIDIYGWNLGLIFAPLSAGYMETVVANRLLGENIGAISAFILFIDTTFYSFILKNPTLGFNIITAGSIIIILQAAFPTLVNYILLVVVGGFLASFFKTIKKYENKIKNRIKNQQTFKWETKDVEINADAMPVYDELESNQLLNNMNFYFITSSDMLDMKHRTIRQFHSEVIVEKDNIVLQAEREKTEYLQLIRIKDGKDECLIKLASKVKKHGGNGIMDLTLNYSLIGFGGDNIQITAMGTGIYIE